MAEEQPDELEAAWFDGVVERRHEIAAHCRGVVRVEPPRKEQLG